MQLLSTPLVQVNNSTERSGAKEKSKRPSILSVCSSADSIVDGCVKQGKQAYRSFNTGRAHVYVKELGRTKKGPKNSTEKQHGVEIKLLEPAMEYLVTTLMRRMLGATTCYNVT